MEPVAHAGQAVGGADQGRLRGGEGLAGGQGPAQGRQAHHQPDVLKLAALRLGGEAAAVEQGRPPAHAVILPRVPLAQDHEGVVLVAGHAPGAAHPLHAGAQGHPAGPALPGVAAVEGDHVQISPAEVQAEAHHPAQPDGGGPGVGHAHSPGDEVLLLPHAVQQLHLQPRAGVPQGHGQGFPALPVEGGQALQSVFALPDLGPGKTEI